MTGEIRENSFFEAMKIREDLWQILGQGGELCYLLEGEEKAILIDGLVGAGSLKAFVRELTDKPVTMILTHGHLDHTGAVWEYGECLMHPDDIALMYSQRHSGVLERYHFAKMQGPLATHQNPSLTPDDIIPPKAVRTYPLYDGDIIDAGGIQLEAIAVPGHTFGTLVFLDRKNRVLFSGDACNINTLLGMTGCTSIEQYLESLRHLESFSEAFDVMYGGHGRDCVPNTIVNDAISMCGRILAGTDDAEPAKSMDGEDVFYGSNHRPDYLPACGGLANIQYSRDRLYKKDVRRYQPE